MNQLVKDLLNLSQIESGYFRLEKEVFNISSMIESVINRYRAIFEEDKIKLSLIKDEDAIAYGDMVRIEQIVINYINNALNHVDDKRVINVTIKQVEDKICVEVFNSGKAIPEEVLDKIWQSFYKVDKARTRSYGGSGLGLSIVKGIQDLHRNKYGVENLEDGVNFWFHVDKASN
ncbi:Sensor histidine kinase ResE [bioreactor metagenome]|uniref:histidine kinase n=1 Tax=bioreactor metagenome TaxID=1076179 RepID=A0A645HCH8_9ZZZZ